MNLRIEEFQLLSLHIRDVGPFQGQTHTFHLQDKAKDPANLYMILSANGLGKTTILECLAHALALMGSAAERVPIFADFPDGAMQLDVRLRGSLGGLPTCGILRLLSLGRRSGNRPLAATLDSDLERRGASWWLLVTAQDGALEFLEGGLSGEGGGVGGQTIGRVVWKALIAKVEGARAEAPILNIEEPISDVPTVLYFTASRDLRQVPSTEPHALTRPDDWSQRLVRRFGAEPPTWQGSIDHLLVWLDYWDSSPKGLFASAKEVINRSVFQGREGMPKRLDRVDRARMEAVVVVDYPANENHGPFHKEHRIDQLSGGERALAQIFVRIAAHMSRHTIVLIDEADLHLHPRMERGLVWTLRDLVRRHPGMTIIFTSHSTEMLKTFDIHGEERYYPDRDESPIRKGGFLIEDTDFYGGET